ncbi:MAG: nitronate monooxygenase family protein [Holosporaceae bacterium]|jgi:enoyl-[acyl-carrier protein] reductase II|nr:nitronate monooxygenase family protein [Holosporaceae bacterium]
MTNYQKINKLMERGRELLGSKYALLGGAMTWISDANLVSAMANRGMFGVLASGAMDGIVLSREVASTQLKTPYNFGVNIILMNPHLHDLVDVCGAAHVSHIVFAGGIPDKTIIDKSHSYGMRVFAFAPILSIAKRLFKHGIDALILEGNEAGGHVGSVSTMVLIQDILLNMKEYPIVVAGGILRGEVFASLLQLGAVACQMGTIFACSRESGAHPNFKRAFLQAKGRDAATPVQLHKKFSIAPVRAIANRATEEFVEKQREIIARFERGEISAEDGQLMLEHFWVGALRIAVKDGNVDRGSLMSGQIVQLITKEKSLSEIISDIMNEAELYLNNTVCSG